MNAGEIGAAAGRIFNYKAPLNWIIRSQEDQDDHGIDCEIELKDSSGKALGQESLFKIQLKGQESCSFIDEGQKLSFSVSRARLQYYLKFNIPVILVVVEVSSEEIYWVSVTNNKEILEKVRDSSTDSLTVHLPVENKLERNDSATFDKLLEAVQECWDYLSLRDLKHAVNNCKTLQPEALNTCIEQVGDALFKAYHIKLDQLLLARSFNDLYQQASDIIQSRIVPAKDRFLAALYFDYAFKVAPYKQVKNEQIKEQLKLCEYLVICAREQKESAYRLTAIAKARSVLFSIQVERLHALHHSNENFKSDSFEYLFMNREIHKQYHEACAQLQKIINMCHRLVNQSQFNILADLMCDVALSIDAFKTIHNARGSNEAIVFLDEWFEKMLHTVLMYSSIVSDMRKIERLYLMVNLQSELKTIVKFNVRSLILEYFPSAEDLLDTLDNIMASKEEPKPLYEASIEEQKQFFAEMAKNLGMDPDDPASREGQFVAIGLANYDPTDIIGHCEHMFVDYRPRGMIAQQLGMHSLSMPIMTCLKHKHTVGTGNLLIKAFDNSKGPEFVLGFKQNHCDKCSDCSPREDDWVWNLKWQYEERKKHTEWLDKIDF
ncbi:DUF4365 domain-containing protein [Photobacterium damselae]|uniref:DUF4365 domain-containing protein n=1 Tax=Photobacterium damselae TaxID=38293 RepID=UPI0010FE0CDC|nr:DUF4365 domain-containing protein [Photobacterium damselae]TLS78733.1 DUF4365 domain-containing protein [Photobacterium damselae subsp. damselae]TLS88656.1 DUF4365 domain-containing protein [Photobacterium damselae subsp. damselae]